MPNCQKCNWELATCDFCGKDLKSNAFCLKLRGQTDYFNEHFCSESCIINILIQVGNLKTTIISQHD